MLENLHSTIRDTFFVRAFGFLKVPMIGYLKPVVLEMTDTRIVVKFPLNRRSKNHLGSMYFGALCVGADVAGGLIAMKIIKQSKKNVALVFKDFQAEFLKRPEGDVHFICEQGREIAALVEKTIASGSRENLPVHLVATVPKISGDEPVAKFKLTLSLKYKKS